MKLCVWGVVDPAGYVKGVAVLPCRPVEIAVAAPLHAKAVGTFVEMG